MAAGEKRLRDEIGKTSAAIDKQKSDIGRLRARGGAASAAGGGGDGLGALGALRAHPVAAGLITAGTIATGGALEAEKEIGRGRAS